MTPPSGKRSAPRRVLGFIRIALLGLSARLIPPVTRWAGLRSFRDHHFYSPVLNSMSEVWDLGANVGDFSALMSRHFACRSFAIEPSPQSFDAIPAVPGLEKRLAAVGSRAGEATLFLLPNSEACSLIPGFQPADAVVGEAAVAVDTFATLRAHRGRGPDLVKLDIEGAELDVLRNLTDDELLAVPQWTVEFHDFVSSQMRPDVEKAKARFKRLGFKDVVAGGPSNVDCLFLQSSRCGLTFAQSVALGVLRHLLLPAQSFLIRQSWPTH